jgi:biotin carboxyl carrier protein
MRASQENDLKLTIGIGAKTYEVEVEIPEDDSAPKPHYIPAQGTAAKTAAPAAPAAGAPKASAPEGSVNESKVCRSPIAGMVTRVDVKPGQQIKANDLLLVLEAMKMETTVPSPVAGTVKTVKVAQGDGVKLNQVLVEFE